MTAVADRLAVTLTVDELDARIEAAVARAFQSSMKRARVEAPQRPTMSVAEAARDLGVCAKTIGRWIADGRLQSVRIGGRRLVLRASVDARLLEGGSR